jgi:ribosomal protein S18 acetylase RimI-like enzyme
MESIELPVSIRQFRFPDDYPMVYTLWEEAGPGIHLRRSDTLEEIGKKSMRDPDLFLVAEIGGRLIGSILGGFDGRRGIMYHLAVQHDFRNRGIASRLVEELERRLKSKGCLRYYLLVTKDNQNAIDFYEKRGWQRMELFTYAKDIA